MIFSGRPIYTALLNFMKWEYLKFTSWMKVMLVSLPLMVLLYICVHRNWRHLALNGQWCQSCRNCNGSKAARLALRVSVAVHYIRTPQHNFNTLLQKCTSTWFWRITKRAQAKELLCYLCTLAIITHQNHKFPHSCNNLSNCMGIPMLKVRRLCGHLIFNMGMLILTSLYWDDSLN